MTIRTICITLSIAAATLLSHSCTQPSTPKKHHTNDELRLSGDKTVYGLACEGTNDSTVVLLPSDGSDPISYDILDASRNHKVLGDIDTGDWIGLMVNPTSNRTADLVIDLDELKGIWCYIVMPTMRDYSTMSPRLQKRIMQNMSDSVKQNFLIPREYGFWLKRQWEATSVGYVQEASTLADESPVVYPPLGYFVNWHIWNGYFVMVSGKPTYDKDNKVTGYTDVSYDTCSIDYLGNDSLVLTDRDGSRSYYRKRDIKEVNKKAQAIIDRRTEEALKKSAEN